VSEKIHKPRGFGNLGKRFRHETILLTKGGRGRGSQTGSDLLRRGTLRRAGDRKGRLARRNPSQPGTKELRGLKDQTIGGKCSRRKVRGGLAKKKEPMEPFERGTRRIKRGRRGYRRRLLGAKQKRKPAWSDQERRGGPSTCKGCRRRNRIVGLF